MYQKILRTVANILLYGVQVWWSCHPNENPEAASEKKICAGLAALLKQIGEGINRTSEKICLGS
jgi:hypothetical protein